MAKTNSRMKYLNVSLSGLRGRHHPALNNIITTLDVKKSRIHLKMLAGDYLTYEVKANQSGGSAHCRCCPLPSPTENLAHILKSCVAYCDIRQRVSSEYEQLCQEAMFSIPYKQIVTDDETFCQFVLDPASFNLKDRVNINDPVLDKIFKLSRDYCFAINAERMRILNSIS